MSNSSETNTSILNTDSDMNDASIESNEPMIGSSTWPSCLLDAYAENPLPGFIPGIKYLASKYPTMRRVKGDGNCFYRSFLFSYLEQLLRVYHDAADADMARSELNRFRTLIADSKDLLIAIGYEEFTFDYFLETLLELLDSLFTCSVDDLLLKFQADGESDYYAWYMRLLTAMSLRRDADKYLPFILDTNCADIDSFCRKEVEPMGRECDQMQIIAIASYLGVQVNIEYLDGKLFDEAQGLSLVTCGEVEGDEAMMKYRSITLLYRPGHYDILYQ